LYLLSLRRGGTVRPAGLLYYDDDVPLIACRNHNSVVVARLMPKSRIIIRVSSELWKTTEFCIGFAILKLF
jgi:hypothetical protein